MPRQPVTSADNSFLEDQDYENTTLPATIEDLDWEAVRNFLAMRMGGGQRADSIGGADMGAELERRLTALGLGSKQGRTWRPNVAGMLLFGRYPEMILPQMQIKVARFRGNDASGMIADRAELGGSVMPLVESVVQFVSRNMRVAGPIDGIYRRDTPEYPLRAVREAISNAIAHRDYHQNGQKVLLRMFDDRLEIESPGGLAGPVTLDTLEMRRYSRNPRLAQGMYTLGLVEEMGTGIRRIRHELALLGAGIPQFRSDAVAFMVSMPALLVGQDIEPPTIEAAAPSEDDLRKRRAQWLRQGISPRQATAVEYVEEKGRITNREFRELHPEISDEAARLDLVDLVERGHLMKIGSNRGTYYVLRG